MKLVSIIEFRWHIKKSNAYMIASLTITPQFILKFSYNASKYNENATQYNNTNATTTNFNPA